MENIQVYYYTRTGRSKKIAEKIAEENGAGVFPIVSEENFSGAVGFIKGGAKASKKEDAKIEYAKVDKDKTIILAFPIWAGTFPPAVNTFIKENDKGNIILVATSLKTKLKDRDGYKKVIDLIGKDIDTLDIPL